MSSAVPESGLPLKLIAALGLLSATAPIATDLYLASFPEMQDRLGTDAQHIQLTLTAFLLGIGLGQLLWGPISDRFGRRRPLLIGTTIATAASVVCVLAPNVTVLIGGRFIQALAASVTLVLSRAVVTDLARGFKAAHAMGLMMTINAVAPVLAPIVGGLMSGHVPWRGVLAVILAFMVAQTVVVLTVVGESLPAERRVPTLTFRPLLSVVAKPTFIAYAATMACAFGALMAYISSSSFVYQNVLDLPGWAFGLGFGVNSIGIMAAGAVSTRLARNHVHPARTVTRALPALLLSSLGVLVFALSPWPGLLLVALFGAVCCVGFIMGNCVTLAMDQARSHTGAASAVVGAGQFLIGSVASALGGVAGEETAVPMALTMIVSASLALACFRIARRRVDPASEAAFAAAPTTPAVPAADTISVGGGHPTDR